MQNYTVEQLSLSDLKTPRRVVIPKFQRGIVWTKEHRKDFIETIKTGDPFGVILVYQEKNGDPYILIDGLQRCSTFKAYMSNPLDFIDADKYVNNELVDKIFEAKYKALGMQLPKIDKLQREEKKFLKKFLKILKDFPELPNPLNLYEMIADSGEFGFDENNLKTTTAFYNFYNSFTKSLDLPDIKIPAIVYNGAKDRLPTVFENLNTSSVMLTKYEIFSSTWPITYTPISDEQIIKYVWKKYADLENKSTFDVETTEEEIRNKGITLFEYCFALSELLNDKDSFYSYLFAKEKKTTDPIGFEILSLLCGLGINRADLLAKDEYLGKANGLFLSQLKDAIIDTVNFVATVLKDGLFDLKGSCIKHSSAYQIDHIIVTAFRNLYDFNSKVKYLAPKDSSYVIEWKCKFQKYAFKWYLYHVLTNFWNNHRQVTDLKNLLEDDNSKDMYITKISRTQWENVLTEFFDQQKNNATTRAIDSGSKLLMSYYYKMLINEDYNRQKYFEKKDDKDNEIIYDIEHIVVVDSFKDFDEELPMSAFGNLCYLPVKDNRSKRNKTIYQYAEDRPSLVHNNEFLDLISYPTYKELEFMECPFDQFKEGYEKLLSVREQKISTKFIDLIMKD